MNIKNVFAVFLSFKKNTQKSGSVVIWYTFIHGPSDCPLFSGKDSVSRKENKLELLHEAASTARHSKG